MLYHRFYSILDDAQAAIFTNLDYSLEHRMIDKATIQDNVLTHGRSQYVSVNPVSRSRVLFTFCVSIPPNSAKKASCWRCACPQNAADVSLLSSSLTVEENITAKA